MTLFEGEKEKKYIINSVFVEHLIARRLEALGLNDGTEVCIMSKKRNGAMIIKVRGFRIALGKHITSMIEVKEQED